MKMVLSVNPNGLMLREKILSKQPFEKLTRWILMPSCIIMITMFGRLLKEKEYWISQKKWWLKEFKWMQ